MSTFTIRRRSLLRLGAATAAFSALAGRGFAQGGEQITVSWFGGNVRTDLYNALVDEYEAARGVTVGRQYAPYADYFLRLGTQAVAGQMPDVVNMTHREVRGLADRGWLVNLNDYVEQNVIDLSSFEQSVIDSGKVRGDNFMISTGNSGPVMFYNEDLFADAGIEPPSPDWDWPAFEELAISFVGQLPEGHYAVPSGIKNHNMLEVYLRHLGVTMFDDEGRIAFGAEHLTQWFEMWGRLRDAGASPDGPTASQDAGLPEPQRLFATGRAAMMSTNANQLHIWQNYQTAHRGDTLNLTYLPEGTRPGISAIVGAYFGIATNSRNPDQAADFIDWFVNDPDMVQTYQNEHGVLGNTELQQMIEPQLRRPEQLTSALMQELVPIATPFPAYPANGADISSLWESKADNFMFDMTTAEGAVQEFFSEVASIAEFSDS